MVTSIILIHVERSKINEVAELLAEMKGISEVYSVSGNYDLVAIANHMHKIDDILATETMLAFQAYSRHDLEAMFSIGIEK